ncbi:MAG: SDR family NAD(P)-dependent oxidoreductase [Candidatus Brachytrichaceae bacterium NZ_4S206]|jgi:NAD(P)-dependent dehydrogenase (short-subunit alcohol dehydrogenase family)
MRLKDKVCVITGAGSGIGRGTALLFAEHGATLVLVDRDLDGLTATQAQLPEGVSALAVRADVSKAADIARVVENALREHGRIDVVFNNAGIMPHGDLLDFTEQTWDEVMAVNVKGMFLMCKAVIPAMLVQGGGSIINTSSVMATLTEPGYEAYTSSKAAVIGLTKAIAVSYAEKNIRCNAICPGWVDTPMNLHLLEEMGEEQLKALIKRQQPTGRMATTREVAYCVLFLASDESSGVTGSALYVDGAASAAI